MYIYQRENWWQFRYDSNLILAALSPIRRKQGLLMGKLSLLGFDVQNNALLDNLSLDIIKSAEIEGELLNPEQVRSSIARRLGIDNAGISSSSRYIEGIVDMMLDASLHYDIPLTHNRLFGWHNVLFPYGRSGLYKIDVAMYRTNEMKIVSGPMGKEKVHYQAPPACVVEDEMDRLFHWINADTATEPIVKAAIAHLWFVSIHPFDDGNGRIGRAITDLLLARADNSSQRFYSISSMFCQHRNAYYDILERTQHGDGDITEWLLWFIDCLDKSLDYTESVLQSAMAKHIFWTQHKDTEINMRQRKILNILLDGFEGNLNTSRWSRICHCSRDTALKDANDLISKGILSLSDGRGRSTSYILYNPAHQHSPNLQKFN